MKEETLLQILQTLKKLGNIMNSFRETEFNNFHEMYKFLERHELPELTEEDK